MEKVLTAKGHIKDSKDANVTKAQMIGQVRTTLLCTPPLQPLLQFARSIQRVVLFWCGVYNLQVATAAKPKQRKKPVGRVQKLTNVHLVKEYDWLRPQSASAAGAAAAAGHGGSALPL